MVTCCRKCFDWLKNDIRSNQYVFGLAIKKGARNMRFVIGFIGSAIPIAVMWWLSGFDFDHRSVDVAFGFVLSLLVSFLGGILLESTKY
jgi:hypothetical protein